MGPQASCVQITYRHTYASLKGRHVEKFRRQAEMNQRRVWHSLVQATQRSSWKDLISNPR